MDIKILKQKIESKTIGDEPIIMSYMDNNFIPIQYINEIAKIKNMPLVYLENLSSISVKVNDIFGFQESSNELRIFITENFTFDDSLLREKNIIIITNKLDKDFNENLLPIVVEIPKLEEWQIKDYVYSRVKGVDQKELDKLINTCGKDIFRIEQEIKKLDLFTEIEKSSVFNDLISEGNFNDLSEYNIFNLSNAIVNRNINELKSIYKEIDRIDVEPVGLITVLINNFKKVIAVQLGNNPSSLGVTDKQVWAIRHSCGKYSKDELIYIYKLLTSLDKGIKTGTFPTNIIVDYLVIHIVNMNQYMK